MNNFESELSPKKQSVFNRLYSLSFKASPLPPALPPPAVSSAKRSKIENDLILRYRKQQAKVHSQRVNKASSDLKQVKSVPQIDSYSEHLVRTAAKDQRPNAIPSSLSKDLKSRLPFCNRYTDTNESARNDIKIELSSYKCSILKQPITVIENNSSVRETSQGLTYESVLNTFSNIPSSSLHPQFSQKYQYDLDAPLSERSEQWNKEVERKVRRLKNYKEKKELKECTFSPLLYTKGKKEIHIESNNLEQSDKLNTKEKLTTTPKQLASSIGFNLKQFEVKAKPMINYKQK